MDPLVMLGGIGATLKAIKDTAETIKWMQGVYESYQNSDRTLQLILIECNVYADSIKAIGKWIEENAETHTLKKQINAANNAMMLVRTSMMVLQRDMEKVVSGNDRLSIKIFRNNLEVKWQWFVETMKNHLTELRHHSGTLQLTLQVIQLTRPTEMQVKAPERLDSKTKSLEKRLLLRHFLTKALEVKRIELNATAEKTEHQRLIKAADAPGLAVLRTKPSLYDVAQHVRQVSLPPPLPERPENMCFFDEVSEEPDQLSSESFTKVQKSHGSSVAPKGKDAISVGNEERILSQNSNSQGTDETSIQQAPLLEGVSLAEEPQNLPTSGPRNGSLNLNKPSSAAAQDYLPTSVGSQISMNEQENALEISPLSTATPSLFSRTSTFNSGSTASSGVTRADVNERKATILNQQRKASHSSISAKHAREKGTMARDKVSLGSQPSSTKRSSSPLSITFAQSPPAICETPELNSPVMQSNLTEADVKTQDSDQKNETEPNENIQDSLSQDSDPDVNGPDPEGFPWLVKTASDGNESMLQKLLNSNADINAVHTSTKRHALSEASIQGHEKVVELLIREGANLEHKDAESCTALHHVCIRGELNIAKQLLANSATIDVPGPNGQSPLHLAIAAPHNSIAMLLLQRQANVNARDAHHRTALHLSAMQGNLTMCTLLLDHGAQLDNREMNSKTALQLACEMGHYEIVETMLESAKLKPKDLTFHTAFFAAVEHGHVRIAESFLRRGLKLKNLKDDTHKPATLAAKNGSLDMLELMIREKCNVRDKDSNSWNALHWAAHHGHTHVVERLVANHFTGKGTTAKKETPLILAIKGGHFTTVEALLRSNSTIIGQADYQGDLPIHHACRNYSGSLDIFNLLIAYGAKPGTSNWLGWYPIHLACVYGDSSLVDRLLEQGSHVEEKLGTPSIKMAQTHKMVEEGYWAEARCPYPGSKPLHLACEFEHWDIASHLIANKGADIHSKCSESWTSLHHACFSGYSAMVLYLVNSGASVHAQTTEGKTPLELGFRLSGAPIPDTEKDAVRKILHEAMERKPKKTSIRMPTLRRGKTVEDKNNIVRAATTSLAMIGKSPNPRTMTSPSVMRFIPEMGSSHEVLTKTPSVMTPSIQETSIIYQTPSIQETPPTPAFVPPTSVNVETPKPDSEDFDRQNPLGLSTAHGSSDALSYKTHKTLLSKASSIGLNSLASFDKHSKEGFDRIQRQLNARKKKKGSGGSGAYFGNEEKEEEDGFVGYVESEEEGGGGKGGDDGFLDEGYGTGALKSSGISISGITMGGFDKYPSS